MFSYYIKLAVLSIRRNPILSLLMMSAIAVGIGAFMTMLTVYHIQSGNPIRWKDDVLFHPQLDTWSPDEPYDDARPELPPIQLTWTDAMALQASEIPTYKTPSFKIVGIFRPDNPDVPPFSGDGRMATNDFFAMFDIPFRFGAAWDDRADRNDEYVIVLSKALNDQIFGGVDSTGSQVELSGRQYTVAGVLDHWEPRPKYYDLNNSPFEGSDQYYLPIRLAPVIEPDRRGNTNCWKPEDTRTFQEFIQSECIWLQYWVQLDTREQREAYRDFLGAYLAEQADIGRSARPQGFRLNRVSEWLEINEVVGDDNRVLVGLSFLFLIVCLLNTVGLLLAKFLGRAGEVSVRRALGASRLDIFRQQLIECGFIGLIGGMAGIGLTLVGLVAVKSMYRYQGSESMDMQMVATAFLTAVVASMIAGLWPSWQICRVPPASYLKTQ